jgi:hypothetical protein
MANPPVTATNVGTVGWFRVSRSRGVILDQVALASMENWRHFGYLRRQ